MFGTPKEVKTDGFYKVGDNVKLDYGVRGTLSRIVKQYRRNNMRPCFSYTMTLTDAGSTSFVVGNDYGLPVGGFGKA